MSTEGDVLRLRQRMMRAMQDLKNRSRPVLKGIRRHRKARLLKDRMERQGEAPQQPPGPAGL